MEEQNRGTGSLGTGGSASSAGARDPRSGVENRPAAGSGLSGGSANVTTQGSVGPQIGASPNFPSGGFGAGRGQAFSNNDQWNFAQPSANWMGYAMPTNMWYPPQNWWDYNYANQAFNQGYQQQVPYPPRVPEGQGQTAGRAQPPRKRSRREGRSEGELSSSEEERGRTVSPNRLKDLANDLDIDMDYVNYRSKMEYAAGILQVDLKDSRDDAPSLVSRKRGNEELLFPFSDIIAKHFESAWLAATGFHKMDDIDFDDVLGVPSNPVKSGKRSKPKRYPKMKYYKVKEDSNPGWPMDSLKVDNNFSEVMMGGKFQNLPYFKTLDDWMEMMGRLLAIFNQSIFFNKASAELLSSLGPDLPEEVNERWLMFKDFLEVQNQSFEDGVSVATNTMINMLLEKRDMVLGKSKLSSEEKEAFRFISPFDDRKRLFSGKVNDFWKSKKDINSTRVSEEMISFLKKQKGGSFGSASKAKSEDKHVPDKQGPNKQFSKGKQNNFNKKGQGKKSNDFRNNSKPSKGNSGPGQNKF